MKHTSIPHTNMCLYVCFYFPRHISFSYLPICAPDNYMLRIQLDADLFFTSCPKFSAIKQLLCAWCNKFTQNLGWFGIAERLFGMGLGRLHYIQLTTPVQVMLSLPNGNCPAATRTGHLRDRNVYKFITCFAWLHRLLCPNLKKITSLVFVS